MTEVKLQVNFCPPPVSVLAFSTLHLMAVLLFLECSLSNVLLQRKSRFFTWIYFLSHLISAVWHCFTFAVSRKPYLYSFRPIAKQVRAYLLLYCSIYIFILHQKGSFMVHKDSSICIFIQRCRIWLTTVLCEMVYYCMWHMSAVAGQLRTRSEACRLGFHICNKGQIA